MESVTSLRLKVDSTDVKNAEKDLNNLTKASGSAEKSASSTSTSFLSLNKVLASGAALGLAMQYIKLSDTMTGMQSKLKLVTSSTQELTTAQEELFKIAQKTRQGYAETVNTYSNFALAMGDMGKSQKDILRVTETVNKAIAISGGTAQMAAAATMQLGQAFASGTLRGDELNSILENSKGLAQAIADGMGVPIGKLRTLGSEGKITAEILANALEKSAASVDEKFGKVGTTVEQSMTMISNSLLKVVGEMDNATGASSSLAGSISSLSDIFTSAANSLHNFNIEISRLQDVKKIKTLDDANIALKQIDDEIKGLTTSTDLIDRMGRALNGEVQNRAKLNNLYAAQASLNKKVNTIANEELAIQDKKDKAYKNRVIDTKVVKKEKKAGKTEAQKQAEEDAALIKKINEEMLQDGVNRFKEDIANQEQYHNEIFNLTATEYEKTLKIINDKAEAYRLSGRTELEIAKYVSIAKDDILEAEYLKTLEQFDKLDKEKKDKQDAWIEYLLTSEMTALDAQIALSESATSWASGLDGVAGSMGKIAQNITKLGNIELKTAKARTQADKTRSEGLKLAGKDIDKIAKIETDHTETLNAIKADALNQQLQGYSALAGALAGAMEEGSTGAKAMMIVQQALATTSAVAMILAAGASGGPAWAATAAAAATVAAGLLGAANIAFSGGGGSSAPTIDAKAMTEAKIDIEQTSVIDRLDKQIQILESIDKNGSALSLSVELNTKTFKRDYDKFVNESLDKMFTDIQGSFGSGGGQHLSYIDITESDVEKALGFNLIKDVVATSFDELTGEISSYKLPSAEAGFASIDKEALATGDNFIKLLEGMANGLTSMSGLQTDWSAGGYEIFFDKDWEKSQLTPVMQAKKNISDFISQYQEIVSEYTMSLINSMDELTSAKDSFEDSYDKITGTDFFQAKKLTKAYNDTATLFANTNISFADNLLSTIDIIAKAEEFLSNESNLASLLDYDPKNLQKQIDTVRAFNDIVGVSVTSVEDVLNFVDSIKLVSEAMNKSRGNIESFISSLRTSQESAEYLAQTMGISLATNVDELALLFNKFAYDINGLTDSELELINANKELLINTDEMKKTQDEYNNTLQETSKSISTLDGALNTIKATIEKLRGASRTSEQNLQIFYDAMAEAQRLSGTDDYAAYAEAVKKAADTSSALFNKDNFALTRDMEYAQLVAANQFEDLQDNTLTQVDILKQIEENTRLQVLAITEAMNNLGMSINAQLSKTITATNGVDSSITSSYANILGRTPESAGASYWSSQLSSGALTSATMDDAIANAAIPEIYRTILGREPDSAGAAYWAEQLSSGAITPDKIDDAIRTAAIANGELKSFAVGTPNVPYDMLANIHKGETIVPAPFADGLRNGSLMMGNQNSLVNELQKNNSLLSGIITKQDQQIQVLLESRDIQNGSLVELENIGVII